jgi:type I restriction enzyme S subunit
MTELPKGWAKSTLGELVDAIREQSKIENTKTYELWSIPSFSDGAPEIIQGSEIGSSKLKVIQDDILISKINPRINRVWLVEDSNLEQLASPEWLVARIKDSNEIDKKFLQFYLSSPEFRDWISRAASSVTGSHSRAKANEILQRDIPLPPIGEQHKIVELLEDHLSRLDAALVDVRQAKLKAAQFRRSLLQAAFSGKLIQESGYGEANWAISELGELCTFITDGSHNPPKGIEKSEYLMLSSRDINNGELTFDKPRYLSKKDFDSENKRTDLQIDDVLLTTVGTIGRTAIYAGVPKNVTFQRSVSVLRPNKLKISSKFLMYFLDSITDLLNREARGVAQQGIYLNQVRKLEIPVPSLEEQLFLVELLDDHLSRLDSSFALADLMENQGSALRRSLLQVAFTGQLTNEVVSV